MSTLRIKPSKMTKLRGWSLADLAKALKPHVGGSAAVAARLIYLKGDVELPGGGGIWIDQDTKDLVVKK